jgi:hypothetical protein
MSINIFRLGRAVRQVRTSIGRCKRRSIPLPALLGSKDNAINREQNNGN